MLKKTQLCLCIAMLPWSSLFAEQHLSNMLIPSAITGLPDHSLENKKLPLMVTARDHLLLEKMAVELPNVGSTTDPVFSQAMQLIDRAREFDQETWTRKFQAISDARVGRIVDLYLQLYDVKNIEQATGLEALLRLRPGLNEVQGYEKACVIGLVREVFFALSQKGLVLSTDEKLAPLAALNLAWWLQQTKPSTLAEVSASIYRTENKEKRIQAAILYNYSHYGNRYGDTEGVSAEELADWGRDQLDEPGRPISNAAKALRVIHEGIHALPGIVQSDEAYLANGFTPKNVQGSYLTNQLPEMVFTGCDFIGYDACSQQDFTRFLDLQHAVGSLAFSLKTTFKLYYPLQGKALDELDNKTTEQLYHLLLDEEKHAQQAGEASYSPTMIFLSHFSQSNEAESLTLEQMARAFSRIAEPIDVSTLPEAAQSTFNRLKQLADTITGGRASILEQERFVLELNALAQVPDLNPRLHSLLQHTRYKTAKEKIKQQLDYLDMRLAYRYPPIAFNEDQAIRDILRSKGVRSIDSARQYIYRQDHQYGYPQKEYDSPVDEFKRRRNSSNRFVAYMSMAGNDGKLIDVFDTMDAKKNEYNAYIKSHPAILALAIEALIDAGERPKNTALQDKINSLAQSYQPETENTRFWGNAWTTLENHWICKVPITNPMCTIARIEGPRYRNDKEAMAEGMMGAMMETSMMRGMERGVKMVETPAAEMKPLSYPEPEPMAIPKVTEPEPMPIPEVTELNRQTIENVHGQLIEVQSVTLKDPLAPGGVREAWVRQGGSGAYWEVDLATHQDVGLVLKQGPEFARLEKLPGGGGGPSKGGSLEFNPEFNPEVKLGEKIGGGLYGDVYLDANNPGFVLKKLLTSETEMIESMHVKEVEYFNRYYGEGSAELIKQGNKYYIRMYRVPGKTLAQINSRIFPPGAKERFLNMMDDLGHYNIIHDDLNFNNVLYNKKTNTFYPIDFDSASDGYYSARTPNGSGGRWGVEMRVEHILEHIEKYTKKW